MNDKTDLFCLLVQWQNIKPDKAHHIEINQRLESKNYVVEFPN